MKLSIFLIFALLLTANAAPLEPGYKLFTFASSLTGLVLSVSTQPPILSAGNPADATVFVALDDGNYGPFYAYESGLHLTVDPNDNKRVYLAEGGGVLSQYQNFAMMANNDATYFVKSEYNGRVVQIPSVVGAEVFLGKEGCSENQRLFESRQPDPEEV